MSDTVVLSASPVVGPKPGDVIAERYRLERELGRGAMGTVWSAMHTTLGQRVAIKLIAEDKARSPEARQRFGVEAKAAARLRSRHVVQVYDDGETADGTPYIVMEYLEGQTLEQRLEHQRDIGLGEAVRITTHVGRALARAHAQGVVHRDLKAGNIFIAKSEDDELGWVAKVLDFGVAKVLTESAGPSATRTGTIVGTPLFMSPEQIRGAAHVDHRADLYSLGMVFYNMVTGSHAFDGPSYSDVLVAICTQTLPDIRIAAPWLPPSLGAWFDKACARDREQRFQSADELVEALQQAAGPGARLSRPSIPDEIAGPSGTLVGHVPPHAASTMLVRDFAAVPPSLAHAPPPSVAHAPPASHGAAPPSSRRETTLRSSPPEASTPANAPLRSSLWLWALSGAGLAVLATGFALVVTRAAALWHDHGASSTNATNIAAPLMTTPVVATNTAALPSPARAEPAAPALDPTSVSAAPARPNEPARAVAPNEAPAAVAPPRPATFAEAHASAARRPASTPRRAEAPVSPRAVTLAPSPPAKSQAPSGTPDMGF
jgi:serine/threonine-protein kinase